jgi:hypothetical protein
MSLGGLVNVFVCSVTLKDHSWAYPVKIFTCAKSYLLPCRLKRSSQVHTLSLLSAFLKIKVVQCFEEARNILLGQMLALLNLAYLGNTTIDSNSLIYYLIP